MFYVFDIFGILISTTFFYFDVLSLYVGFLEIVLLNKVKTKNLNWSLFFFCL